MNSRLKRQKRLRKKQIYTKVAQLAEVTKVLLADMAFKALGLACTVHTTTPLSLALICTHWDETPSPRQSAYLMYAPSRVSFKEVW